MDREDQDDAPLPPGWSRGYSKSQQRTFYFHAATKHTQWHFPTASEAKDPSVAKQRTQAFKEREQFKTGKREASQESSSVASSSSLSQKPSAASINSRPPSASSFGVSAPAKKKAKATDDFLELADATSVAIIVPYRDLHPSQHRAAHLKQFVPHMTRLLTKLRNQGLVSDFHIYVVEQSSDGRKFNRGKLLNIGFDLARKRVGSSRRHDVYIFHDVDLLPQDDLGHWYAKFPVKPIHIARVWNRYSNNPKYFGGVVSFSASDYRRINGYPNTFWGWGGEDDEMQRRLEKLGIQFDSPPSGTLVDLEDMNLKEKLDFLRENRSWKCMVKWEAADEHDKTWRQNGLEDLKYSILQTVPLDDGTGTTSSNSNNSKATKFTVDVKLNGDHWSNEKSGLDFTG